MPAYPTPPFSPSPSDLTTTDNSLQSTMTLLDALVDFYQEERMWVDRVRSNLAHASSDGSPGNRRASEGSGKHSKDSQDSERQAASTRWTHRKNGFGLRLDTLSKGGLPVSGLEQKEHILELFDKMIETRMESCERVNQLLRQVANSR